VFLASSSFTKERLIERLSVKSKQSQRSSEEQRRQPPLRAVARPPQAKADQSLQELACTNLKNQKDLATFTLLSRHISTSTFGDFTVCLI
jgi:predicted house-cleaning NTP pyrophosphatase (Maf/HAM1 superfamily)